MQDRTYTALVTFDRTGIESNVLPPEAQGACGYIAVSAKDEDELRNILLIGLKSENLRLLEIDQISEFDLGDISTINDDHLRSNVARWETGKRWVWGTVHIYLADGEA